MAKVNILFPVESLSYQTKTTLLSNSEFEA